ncbi:MAG: heme-binding protein, partial [Verrucomicrobia bacterium]
ANGAAVCFDTDTLRLAAAWTDGWLDVSKTHLDSYKGSHPALVQGAIQFDTKMGPGWAKGDDFNDPRALRNGPLPKNWAKYKGLYRHGDQVGLAYTVGGDEVLESPGYEKERGLFTRTFHIENFSSPKTLLVCEVEGATPKNSPDDKIVFLEQADSSTAVGLVGAPAEAKLAATSSGRIHLDVPALKQPATFKLALWKHQTRDAEKFTAVLNNSSPITNPKDLIKGGPALWPETLTTRGRLGIGTTAYVVDTLTVPETNPWRSWMRFAAHDFFSDGRAAVSTWNGDVWIVSGIDEKLERLTWKRFAAGLYEGLGLKIVDDKIYVLGRDQITRLHDLNHDGEADFYENFNNDASVAPSYHGFAMELWTDRAGNFYYTRCGQRADPDLPFAGALLRVSRDGSMLEKYAFGLRAANGLSVGPNDQITFADNQGNWVPSSRLDLAKQGRFYGWVPHSGRPEPPTDYEKPICWIPMTMDNSSGGQAWVTSDKWGPFKGHLLHTSYGKATLFHVLMEQVDGQAQGGVWQFPLKFDSGIMRARFHPRDGQLYVSGLKGWQTAGARDAALQRVRYTGKPVNAPLELHAKKNGLQITFTEPLDKAPAIDDQNYAIEQWNYRWTDPAQVGHDPVAVKSITLSADAKTVFLEIPDLKPVMQMKIKFSIQAADGSPIKQEIYNTINRLPAAGDRR